MVVVGGGGGGFGEAADCPSDGPLSLPVLETVEERGVLGEAADSPIVEVTVCWLPAAMGEVSVCVIWGGVG